MSGLQQKSVLVSTTVIELEASLKERDTLPSDSTHLPADLNGNGESGSQHSHKTNGVGRLDKRQIEQRIEEDRERHKRLKESIWGVGGEEQEEYVKMYEEGSDIGEDDTIVAEEDSASRNAQANFDP